MAENLLSNVIGLDDLLVTLENISQDMKKKGGRTALRKAAKLIESKVKEGALGIDRSSTPQSIAKNVTVQWNGRRFRRTGDLGFRVGIRGGAKNYVNSRQNQRTGRAGRSYAVGGSTDNPGGDTYYWRFLEFGTRKMAAQPFMRQALERNTGAATDIFINEYKKSLDRLLRRQNRA